MDDGVLFFIWLLLWAGFFAFLGCLFGGLTGYTTWREGRAAGSWVGLSVARAFDRLRDEPLAGAVRALLVAGCDGLVFGLVIGLVLGLITGWRGPDWRILGSVMLAGLFLVVTALLLGAFAGIMLGGGTRSVVGMFFGAAMMGVLGWWMWSFGGLFAGLLAGGALGALLGRVGGK